MWNGGGGGYRNGRSKKITLYKKRCKSGTPECTIGSPELLLIIIVWIIGGILYSTNYRKINRTKKTYILLLVY